MAITISGENNNDRITAQDGVIDTISGFNIAGIITASSFTGDLTGNVTGNLTGNVNSTSPLLLQTGGSERFRITGNNELGIAGANYGSAGQVLTSGGSGSAVTWSAIPAQITFSNPSNNRILTSEGGIGVNAEANLTWDGNKIHATATGEIARFQSTNSVSTIRLYSTASGHTEIGHTEDTYIAVGSAERLRIKGSNGYVGISTSSPGRMLHIFSRNTGHPLLLERGDGSNTQIEIKAAGVTRGYWGSSSTANFMVYDNDTSHIPFQVTQDGKVLVGDGNSITPSRNLDVRGTGQQQILIGSTNNSGASIIFDGHGGGDGSGGNYGAVEMGSDGHFDIRNYDPAKNIVFGVGSNIGSNDSVVINSNGKVIIGNNGTTFGNAAVQAFIQHGNTAGESGFSSVDTTSVAAGVGGEISFHGKYNTGAQDWAYFGHIRGTKENATAGNTACALKFFTRPNAVAPQERLRITSDGQIQAGTSAPTYLKYTGSAAPTNNNNGTLLGSNNIGLIGQYSTFNQPFDHSSADTSGNWWMLGRGAGTTNEWGLNTRSGGLSNLLNVWKVVGDSNGHVSYQSFHTSSGTQQLRLTNDGKILCGAGNYTGAGYPSVLQVHGASALIDLNTTNNNPAIIYFYEQGAGRFRIQARAVDGFKIRDTLNSSDKISIHMNGDIRLDGGTAGGHRSSVDVRQATGRPPFNIGFADGSFYRNLGTEGPRASDGTSNSGNQYLHVRFRTTWNDYGMTMFRITGYISYSDYTESYVGMYRYGNSGYRTNPYGLITHNQKRNTVVAAYNTTADPGYLVIVCDWNTDYMGLMFEHIGAGSSYGSMMQQDLEIIDSKRSSGTTDPGSWS